MHILIDARYLSDKYSGIGTYSRCLIENLAHIDRENAYTVLVSPSFDRKIAVGDNFEFLSWKPRPISWRSYLTLHDLLRHLKPDLVHSLAPHAPIFHDGPLVVTVHDMQPFVDPEFSGRRLGVVEGGYRLFYRWAYPTVIAKAKWVICDSYATRDDIARLLPGAIPKLVVAHPGLKPSSSDPPTQGHIEAMRAKLDLSGRYLLYYGSTRPNKNLPNLVRAFARLINTPDGGMDDLKLVLVVNRDRFFREVLRIINSRKIQGRVLVTGQLDPAEQQAVLAGALAFVFPTKYEGFGFPPLEALRAGVPVLAGRSGSLPEVLEDAAHFVDPDDVDDIADGMKRLVEDDKLRRRLIRRGEAILPRYDWTETAGFIQQIYTRLLGPGEPSE